ncbi:hypothetical protein INT45_008647 [Circinella minor]|uniref:Uncharacterized protein n=1 Tax=Circinella minor TaxID=1195481 RepID=A0A8H7RJA9_9FUNG|nr:hypothetical protein INT45_008647 [Circinella minor]
MAKDLLEFEDVLMQDDIYSTRELSNALPYADFVESPSFSPSSSSSSSFSPSSSSSPSPSPSLSPRSSQQARRQQSRRVHRTYTQEDIIAVLKAYFFQGLRAEQAGAIVGMPQTTAAKLIHTYRPQMPAPPPLRRSQPRAPRQSSMISRVNSDMLAAALQQ